MQPILHQGYSPLQTSFTDDTLGSGDFSPPNTPPMKPVQPNTRPTASPPPEVTRNYIPRFSPGPSPCGESRDRKMEPRSGDATLISLMGGGRNVDVIREAATRAPPSLEVYKTDYVNHSQEGKDKTLSLLARDALDFVPLGIRVPQPRAEPNHAADISVSTQSLSIHDGTCSPRPPHSHRSDTAPSNSTRPTILDPSSTGLPPIAAQSTEPTNQSLPSLRSTFGSLGDIKLPPPDPDLINRRNRLSIYPNSPPILNQLPPFSAGHGSPPISPPDSNSRSLPSPRSITSSPYRPLSTVVSHRTSNDYSSSTGGDTSSAEHSHPTPATSVSAADRMSIDGITTQNYICTEPGCKAPPFQTQYLLNSHANVHSSARPHYCPVYGCPRSEGGKGFKRKNEMIRHGLVHESPGYICPFCPDRDHRYPRPDNLQRHVRVHHLDKSKDDPLLRDVLAQRADGPNRGRRRRGGG